MAASSKCPPYQQVARLLRSGDPSDLLASFPNFTVDGIVPEDVIQKLPYVHYACKQNDLNIVVGLVKLGASLCVKAGLMGYFKSEFECEDVSCVALRQTPLHFACEGREVTRLYLVQWILSRQAGLATINEPRTVGGERPLHWYPIFAGRC